jgi:hypothetical protein
MPAIFGRALITACVLSLCRRALGLDYPAIFVEAELPDDQRYRLDTLDIDVLRGLAPGTIQLRFGGRRAGTVRCALAHDFGQDFYRLVRLGEFQNMPDLFLSSARIAALTRSPAARIPDLCHCPSSTL